MSASRTAKANDRITAAVAELKALVLQRYPEASFNVTRGDDPEGVYIWASIDADDLDLVTDFLANRLLELQVDEDLPVYVVPIRPVERVLAEFRAERALQAEDTSPQRRD